MFDFGRIVPALALSALSMSLTGCATAFSTREAAVDYNRSFADARNEVLLLNILRAWAREPMQFSTVAGVTGGVRTGSEITLPFTNILVGGEDSISPTIKFNGRNPNVSINPLASKEFMQGMARPASVDLIDSLLTQGWHRPTVLALTIGGFTCPVRGENGVKEEDVRMNLGEDPIEDMHFANIFRDSGKFTADVEDPTEISTLRMTGKEAAEFLSRGAGEGRRIASVDQAPGPGADVLVKIVSSTPSKVTGLNFTALCGGSSGTHQESVSVIPRSPQGMIFYLAQLHARRFSQELAACDEPTAPVGEDQPVLFRIRVTCGSAAPPIDAAVSTYFQGRHYYLPRSGEAGGGDRTLQALALLAEFIALQTTEAAVAANRPIIAVTQ